MSSQKFFSSSSDTLIEILQNSELILSYPHLLLNFHSWWNNMFLQDGTDIWLLGRSEMTLFIKRFTNGTPKVLCALLTCSSFHHHLSGRDPTADCCYHHRVETAWFERVEAVSADLTGDTFVFDDHIFMDE